MSDDSTASVPISKGSKFVRKLFGLILLLLGISLILAKALIKFPIGLYTTVQLLSAEGSGNVGMLLGRLTGDFVVFVICILSLYFGARLLRRPKQG